MGNFLAGFLAGRGWEVEKTADAPAARERHRRCPLECLRWNHRQTPDLVFSTHMDTVPPYIPFTEDEEFMYGRGVSDAKGIIAAQVAAAEALRAGGYQGGHVVCQRRRA